MSNELRRAAAMFECENAMARHCYHHARGTHRDELEEIWRSDPARHHWKMMKSVMILCGGAGKCRKSRLSPPYADASECSTALP